MERARKAFESRTQLWREVGLGAEIDRREAKRAKLSVLVDLALIAIVLFVFGRRRDLFPGLGEPVRIATVVALVVLGWGLARGLGRSFAPALFRRMDPGTAGSVGFLIRLVTLAIVAAVALRVAGVNASALAVGGAFTTVVRGSRRSRRSATCSPAWCFRPRARSGSASECASSAG